MNEFLFNTKTDPFYLVFLRMSTALILLLSMLSIWPDFEKLYGLNGIVDYQLLELKQGYASPSTYTIIEKGMQYFRVDEIYILNIILLVSILFCTFLFLGLFTKAAALTLLLLQTCIFTSLHQFSYGFDYFCTVALFYCFIFPTHRYGSINGLFYRLKPSKWTGFCLRMLQIHLCFVYFFSGLGKIIGPTWRNGEALWKTVHLPYFNPAFNFDALAQYPWIWVFGGWCIALLELLYPLFIYLRTTRKLALALIILMHLSIAFFLNLYLFSAIMISLNLAAFYYGTPQICRTKQTSYPYAQKAKRKVRIYLARNTKRKEINAKTYY